MTVPLEPLAKVMGAVSPAPNSRTALLAIVKEPVSLLLTAVEIKTWALFVSEKFSDPVKLPLIVRYAVFAARIVPVPLMLPVIVAVVLSMSEPLSVMVSDSA